MMLLQLRIARKAGQEPCISYCHTSGQVISLSGTCLRYVQQVLGLRPLVVEHQGPEPLDDLFKFVVAKFKGAAGRKLTSIECHDIMCKIGEVVVVGGVRRSAMISLSNLSDGRMAHAKSGSWWENEGQRALANNSVAYTDKPDMEGFMREWLSLVESSQVSVVSSHVQQQYKHAKMNGRT